ncbi:uncharacterized protein LOC113464417, partial [Ceratina calcarata]|uniref:Uncharacterized protein LOC113464417 n=1 Tax=Ceratina calcarata TaxID=156304 RepID=A0AAJ7S1P0_9HYME
MLLLMSSNSNFSVYSDVASTSNSNNNDNSNLPHKDKVKRAEIKLSAFFAEHNVAFCAVEHLVPLLKNVCTEPEVVQDLSLARHKCTKIVKNVIAKREVEKIVECLRTCKFSVLIDESTDISDRKLMCIVVKYVSPISRNVNTQLLELLSLDSTDCSASKIFETFKQFFTNKAIPLKNIVGLACDNASVMVGCNNSFMTFLKIEVPELITLKCICHSSALIASHACDQLPSACEKLVRGVAILFSAWLCIKVGCNSSNAVHIIYKLENVTYE